MRRRDWLLLAVGSGMQPIQVQKALFKFAEEAGAPPSQQYRFEPYNWGPCSRQIYSDLEHFRQEALIEFVPTGRGWSTYRVPRRGEKEVAQLRERASPALLDRLDTIRNWVTTRSFNRLLRDVYREYPDYARNSLFRAG